MSEAGGSTGPRPQGSDAQPTEEEVRAYLAQLRQADANDIVAQVFSMVASAAEVKLGRRDGRLLIDVAAAVAGAAGEQVDARLRKQMDDALSQLRLGQVDAERQLSQLRSEGKLPQDESGDLPADRVAASQDAGQEEPAEQAQRSSASSRLWIPGR